jgi:hypothetical protein
MAMRDGDDMVTPFLLVIDQVDDDTAAEIARWPDNISSRTGARHVLCFGETVEIPANEVGGHAEPLLRVGEFAGSEDAERAGTREIVYAHERTRLDLCSALLVSGDMPWRKLVELVAERQRELAGILRERDTLDPKLVALVQETLGIEMTPGGVPYDEALYLACRELEKSEAARAHLRRERDVLNTRIQQVQEAPTAPDLMNAPVSVNVKSRSLTKQDIADVVRQELDRSSRQMRRGMR